MTEKSKKSAVAGSEEEGKVKGKVGKTTKLAKAGSTHGANGTQDQKGAEAGKRQQ